MEWLKFAAQGMGALLVIFGAVALALAFLRPRALDGPFMRWMVTGKRLDPSRSNRVLMSAWAMLGGIYLWLSMAWQVVPALATLAVWLTLLVVLYRRRVDAPQTSA